MEVYARLPGVKPQNIPDWRLLREHTHTQTHTFFLLNIFMYLIHRPTLKILTFNRLFQSNWQGCRPAEHPLQGNQMSPHNQTPPKTMQLKDWWDPHSQFSSCLWYSPHTTSFRDDTPQDTWKGSLPYAKALLSVNSFCCHCLSIALKTCSTTEMFNSIYYIWSKWSVVLCKDNSFSCTVSCLFKFLL